MHLSNSDYNNCSNMLPVLSEDKFQQFLSCGQIAVIYLDLFGCLYYVTPFVEKIIGLNPSYQGKLIGDTPLIHNCPGLFSKIETVLRSFPIAQAEGNEKKRKQLLKKSSTMEIQGLNQIYYQVNLHPYHIDEVMKGYILSFYDLTASKNTEAVMEREKQKYKLIAKLTDCAIWEYDIHKKDLHQYNKLKGIYARESLNIKDYRKTALEKEWIHPEDTAIFNDFCDRMDHGERYMECEVRCIGETREYLWLHLQGACIRDQNDMPIMIVGRTINIDKEHREYEKLLHKSERDALTGLYNRSATKEKIEKCIEQSLKNDQKVIHNFMIIDIDNFKKANDLWGHLFGDLLLENFSKHLEDIFSSTDIIGRIGGDEFVVLKRGTVLEEEIQATADAVCNMARKYMKGMSIDNKITVSIGISSFPKDGKNYDILYHKADIALYQAKSKGKDQYAFYHMKMEQLNRPFQKDPNHWFRAELIDQTTPEVEKRLLNYAVDIMNEAQTYDIAITRILQEIGTYYDLSRIHIFETDLYNLQYNISYQWRNKDIPMIKDLKLKSPEVSKMEYLNWFRQNGVYYVNNVSKSDIRAGMRKYLTTCGIKAVAQCGIFEEDMLVAIVSFEDCIAPRSWDKQGLDTLFTLTKLISTYITKSKNKNDLNNELFFTQATLSNQKLCNYAVRKNSFELVYYSDYTKKHYPDIAPGKLCYEAIYGYSSPCEPCPLSGLGKQNRFSLEAYNEATQTWYSSTASNVISPVGEEIQVITTSDVTGFIDRVNSKDPLTGLMTMSKFELEGMKLIARNKTTNYSILYIDFDKFKMINDEWGYSTGNEILQYFAGLISKYIKNEELFCRVTADIFILLISYEKMEDIIERMSKCVQSVNHYYKNNFSMINLVMIAGIYALGKEDKVLSIAIDRANTARKTVKGNHKSSYAIYDTSMHERVTMENLIESSMYQALEREEFEVYLQPKLNLTSMKIIGAEALVRWRHSSGVLMNPNEFIPIFEKNGFITELDFYVYEASLKAMQQWIVQGKDRIILSLNVSRSHLADSDFLDRLNRLLAKYNIPASLVELEITESMFLHDLDRLIFFVNNIRKHGYLISIDDFGSGYSSLNLLKTLKIDIVKLDREFFLENIMHSQDQIVISGIISIAKGLGFQVIAEGVETKEQLKFIKEHGCDMVQGYLFYRPMPMVEFEKLL